MNISGAFNSLDQGPVGKFTRVVTIQLVFFYALMIVGCATSSTSPEINKPYGVVRATVQKNMPRGIRTTSRNGRTFESQYFVPSGIWEDDGTNARERAFARVTILGASRPYTIQVSVYREKRISAGEYSAGHLDDQLSNELQKKILEDIANRREDRNMIDDFKAF